MRSALLPLQRVRLELERSLRARAFFARAIRGDLEVDAYSSLICGVRCLLDGAADELGRRLDVLARRDLEALGTCERGAASCVGRHVARLVRDFAHCLGIANALDTSLCVIGTSWTVEASSRLGRRFPTATSFLETLGAEGPRSLSRIVSGIESGMVDASHVYAFAELARGSLLALASRLDDAWPAPVVTAVFTLDLPRSLTPQIASSARAEFDDR